MRSDLNPRYRSFRNSARRASVWIALLASTAWLAGCAVAPGPSPEQASARAERQQELTRLTRWQAVGRIGVINGQDGWHANFQWTQHERDYRIDLIGPLGQGRVLIRGDGQQVTIQTQDGQSQTAPDPDSLLERTLGVRLPVEGLRYWIRGASEPGPIAALQTDASGRLLRLEQKGWILEYPAYSPSASPALPARIVARRQDLSVKLVIDQWTL